MVLFVFFVVDMADIGGFLKMHFFLTRGHVTTDGAALVHTADGTDCGQRSLALEMLIIGSLVECAFHDLACVDKVAHSPSPLPPTLCVARDKRSRLLGIKMISRST